MSASITIEFQPGDDIESAFKESVRIAKLLNINVNFNFNGVKCSCRPNSDYNKGPESYFEALKQVKYKFAFI